MEKNRKIVHISMIVFALLIGTLPPALISFTCLTALLFNCFLLPSLTSRSLERAEDLRLGFSPGLLIYPGILLLISILFFHQQIFLAIAWGALAFGDGFASLLGRQWARHRIPWNASKSWEGAIIFVFASVVLSFMLILLLPETLRLGYGMTHWFWVILLSSLFAALWESIPDTIDDNLLVPLSSAVSAYFVHQIFISTQSPQWEFSITYLMVACLLGIASLLTRKITLWGAFAGALITFVLMQAFGLKGLLGIGVFFVLGTGVTGWKKAHKQAIGLAEANQGKRGYANVLANAATAFFLAILGIFLPSKLADYEVMMMASFAAALSDTVSSELGNVYGKQYFSVITWQKGKRGEDGMISGEGSLAGLLAAAVPAVLYFLINGQAYAVLVITLAGFVGNLSDSLLGASLQRKGFLNNHTVNFFNTLLAALLAGMLIGK